MTLSEPFGSACSGVCCCRVLCCTVCLSWCSQLWAFPEASEESSLWFPSGEQLLCEASTVLKYVQEDSCQRGVYGRLVCTDFKISFLGDNDSALDNGGVRMSCVCRVAGMVQP